MPSWQEKFSSCFRQGKRCVRMVKIKRCKSGLRIQIMVIFAVSKKTEQMRNIAVILAGGTGSRMGVSEPKQFLEIAGRLVIEHAIDAFESQEGVDEIAVVMHPSYIARMQEIIARNAWKKFGKLLGGGEERFMSSLAAIRAYENVPDVNLLLHDAARPWISQEIIARLVEALKTHEAVGVGIPSTDTVWEVREGCIAGIPDRRNMWRAQTPQAFRLPLIREAYERALQDPHFQATDDCGVLMRYMPQVKIFTVLGEEQNVKLTYKEDLDII